MSGEKEESSGGPHGQVHWFRKRLHITNSQLWSPDPELKWSRVEWRRCKKRKNHQFKIEIVFFKDLFLRKNPERGERQGRRFTIIAVGCICVVESHSLSGPSQWYPGITAPYIPNYRRLLALAPSRITNCRLAPGVWWCHGRSWYLLYTTPFVMPIQTLSSTNNPVPSSTSISSRLVSI